MQLNDIQLWILQAIALTGDKGIPESSLEATAKYFAPDDVLPRMEEELERLKEMCLIASKYEVTIAQRVATKVERYTITDLGRKAVSEAAQ